MSKRLANAIAKSKYGPTANAVTSSNVMDRHQRFGIVYLEPSGTMDDRAMKLVVAGHGDSFEAALAMAEKNPAAIEYRKMLDEAQKDLEEFNKDPEAYAKKKAQEAFESTKEKTNEQP